MSNFVDDINRQISENIKQHGWHAMGVGGAETLSQYNYSIGLSGQGSRYEYLVLGLPVDVGHNVLHAVADVIKTEGEPALQTRLENIVDGFDVMLEPIPSSVAQSICGPAFKHCIDPVFVQIIWPDKYGRFPNDTDVNSEIRKIQELPKPTEH